MKKRLLALLASVCMLALMLPVGILPTGAATQNYIEEITDPSKVTGYNYTSNSVLADKLTSVFYGDVDIYKTKVDKTTVKDEVSLPLGCSFSTSLQLYVKSKENGKIESGWQCFIYALAVYNYVYGEIAYADNSKCVHSQNVIAKGKSTVSYADFSSAGVMTGACFRTTTSSSGSFDGANGHSMIVLSYDSNSISYVAGNDDGNGLVRIRKQTWADFNKSQLSGRTTPRYVCFVLQPTIEYYNAHFQTGSSTPYNNGFDAHFAGTYRVKSGQTAVLRTGPYSSCDAIASFTSGTFTVLGRVTNSVPNDWYQVNYNGQICYIYHERIEKITDAPSTLTISPSATTYTITQGKSCNIGGSITSNYPITSVQGYLDGARYANFAPNTTSVNIGDYSTGKLNSFKAQDLSVGTHTIEITATDGHKTVSKTLYIVVNGATHTHSYTAYVETAHPHKVYMKCSCGDWYYTGETRKQDGCAECYPPVYYLDVNFYLDDEYTSQACGIVFDVYINESLEASSVSDFCRQYPAGTKYSICNIRATDGYVYGGVGEGPLTGIITSSSVNVILMSYHYVDLYFDVNFFLDGKYSSGESGLIFDVYINGSLVADSVSDYWHQYPPGTTYSISNIRATDGYVYGGVGEGPLTGTMISSSVNVILMSYHLPEAPQISICSRSSADDIFIFWDRTAYTDTYDLHLVASDDVTVYPGITSKLVGAGASYVYGQDTVYYGNTSKCLILHCAPGEYDAYICSVNNNLASLGLSYYTDSNHIHFTVSEGSDAPVAETTYNGHRYELYDNGLTWAEAKAKCEALGGHLVTITSPEEEAAVEGLRAKGTMEHFWIGCTDEKSEGVWKWVTGEIFDYSKWYSGEPGNSYHTATETYENYGSIDMPFDTTYDVFWNDMPYAYSQGMYGYICEYDSMSCGENLTWSLDLDTGLLTIDGEGDMYAYDSASDVPWYPYRAYVKSLVIGDKVTSLCGYAFYHCENLSDVTMGTGITYVGDKAFYYCSGLSRVDITDLSAWCNISFYAGGSSNPLYYAHNLYINGVLATDITIPNDITGVGQCTFYGCHSLTSVTIPSNVKTIRKSAFCNCKNLVSVNLEKGLTEIGHYAFTGCTNLKNISIPYGVSIIGSYAFDECESLENITIPGSVSAVGYSAFSLCTSLSSVNINSGVVTVWSYAFEKCSSLTDITLPNTVINIEENAFNLCNNLTNIYYTGSEEQWGKIAISEGNDPLYSATIHFLGDEIVTGDLTGNASVDADDLTALAKIVAKIDGGSPAAILAADVTHDGKVDADDLTKIAKYVAKIIPNLD